MPVCSNCGKDLDEKILFCDECGEPLSSVPRKPVTFTDVLRASLGSINPFKPLDIIDNPTDVVYEKLQPYSPTRKFLGVGVGIWLIYIIGLYRSNGTSIVPVGLITFVFPVLFFVWMWRNDRYEREPISLLIFIFGWGIVSAELAGYLNWFIPTWLGAPGAAFIEELLKLIGLYFLAMNTKLGKEFNGPMDGIIYGAGIGMGFTWNEDIYYALDGGVPDYFFIALRGLTAFAHLVFTGLAGWTLGVAKAKRGSLVLSDLLAALVPGVILHFVWNAAPGYTSFALIIPYLLIFRRTMKAASLDEERWGYGTRAPVE